MAFNAHYFENEHGDPPSPLFFSFFGKSQLHDNFKKNLHVGTFWAGKFATRKLGKGNPKDITFDTLNT